MLHGTFLGALRVGGSWGALSSIGYRALAAGEFSHILTRTLKGAAIAAAGNRMVGPPSSVVLTGGSPVPSRAFAPSAACPFPGFASRYLSPTVQTDPHTFLVDPCGVGVS